MKNVMVSMSIPASVGSVFLRKKHEKIREAIWSLVFVIGTVAFIYPHKLWFYLALSLSPLALYGLVKGDREAAFIALILLVSYVLPPWAYAIFLILFLVWPWPRNSN